MKAGLRLSAVLSPTLAALALVLGCRADDGAAKPGAAPPSSAPEPAVCADEPAQPPACGPDWCAEHNVPASTCPICHTDGGAPHPAHAASTPAPR